MKTPIKILAFFLLICQIAQADTLTVKQDGTGDYIIIQSAINASTDGDTVLVWPGTYYENLDLSGHNIMLASLDLTTGDPQYKYSTIIDGSQEETSCLWVLSPTTFTIQGFSIRNGSGKQGSGYRGGGLYLKQGNVSIFNCIIHNNFARGYGGGIANYFTNLYLSGTTIKDNHSALNKGGGISFTASNDVTYTITFDTINRCSVYNNHAYCGADISFSSALKGFKIVLDTFSVSQPGRQHVYSVNKYFYPRDSFPVQMNHYLRESVNGDLFVSPTGDDSNNGLSEATPLKSLTKAIQLVVSGSVQKNTIHLANGTYSPSSTGEFFPLGLFSNIDIIGQKRDSTILNAENFTHHLQSPRLEHSFNVKHISLVNGNGDINRSIMKGSFVLVSCDSILFEDLLFKGNTGYQHSSGLVIGCSQLTFKDVTFEDNFGGKTLGGGTMYNAPEYPRLTDSVFIENCIFRHNLPNPDSTAGSGGAFSTKSIATDSLVNILTNCLFENNQVDNDNYNGFIITSYDYGKAVFSNCTFADNTVYHQDISAVFFVWGFYAKAYIYNSIFYGGHPREMRVGSNEAPCSLWIYNSLIAGGYDGIGGDLDFNFVHYDETNIDTDPFFLHKWEHPYQIADGSPCIDAGTLANLPDFIVLPETDLAGNPRIVGDSIDMGAYEWNSTVGIDKYQYQPIKNEKPKLLHAAPNPFNHQTTISAQWDFTGHVQIEIYNNSGLRVKILKSGTSGRGSIQTRWDGKDGNGNILPAGVYHVVMFWDGKEIEGIKVVKR